MNQVFEAVLEVRFRQCPGHRKIKNKEYALRSNTQAEDIQPTIDFRRCFFPGQRVEMIMVYDRLLFKASVCTGCDILPPKSEEDQEPDMEWYSGVALLVIQLLTCCSSHFFQRYQRTLDQMRTNEPEAIKTRIEARIFAPTCSDTTAENPFQPPWLRFMVDLGEQEDTPEQFRSVRIAGSQCGISRTISSDPNLFDFDSGLGSTGWRFMYIGSSHG